MGKNKGIAKTNAMRALDTLGVTYNCAEYDIKDNQLDGVSVANKIGVNPDFVFKTLVTQGSSGNYLVFVIPVALELDLKKAALAANEKSVAMIPVKDINRITGYIKGGCSPIGMKKTYNTFIHNSAVNLPEMTCSAGKIGLQITLSPADLQVACGGNWADIVK